MPAYHPPSALLRHTLEIRLPRWPTPRVHSRSHSFAELGSVRVSTLNHTGNKYLTVVGRAIHDLLSTRTPGHFLLAMSQRRAINFMTSYSIVKVITAWSTYVRTCTSAGHLFSSARLSKRRSSRRGKWAMHRTQWPTGDDLWIGIIHVSLLQNIVCRVPLHKESSHASCWIRRRSCVKNIAK